MAEALSSGHLRGSQVGDGETEGELLRRTEVTDTHLPTVCRPVGSRDRLRTLSVEVSWQRGAGDKQIRMTTCMTENLIRDT
jgi:hypothetical protein